MEKKTESLDKLKALLNREDKPTIESVQSWWEELNVSQRQHAIDPNRWEDASSLSFSKMGWNEMSDEAHVEIIRGYVFRHQKEDLSELCEDGLDTVDSWWDSFNPSQRQHMIDPHQILNMDKDAYRENYDNIPEQYKPQIDEAYDIRNGESKEKGEGTGGGMTTTSSGFNAVYGGEKKEEKKPKQLKTASKSTFVYSENVKYRTKGVPEQNNTYGIKYSIKEGFTYESGVTRDSEGTTTEDRKDVTQKKKGLNN